MPQNSRNRQSKPSTASKKVSYSPLTPSLAFQLFIIIECRKGIPEMERKPMETSTEIEVRYAETDGMGVVYHANYLLYLEVARTDFLNKLGFPYADIEKAGYLSPFKYILQVY